MLTDITSTRDGLFILPNELLEKIVNKNPIAEEYIVEETPFARGKFATVRRATHRATGVQYAAKFIRRRRRAAEQNREIQHEIAVLLKCSGSGRVVKLHEVFEAGLDVVLVLELAAGGELQRVLEGDECLNEPEAKRAMRQILDGLSFLHERQIVHLDLKPQNLLLAHEGSCEDVKLCDFGISRVLEPGVEVRELIGTPDYVAPEVLSYEPISLATDIWSVGVLAYVLLTGYSPFGSADKQQTYLNISKCALSFDPDLFEDVSSIAIDFITSALVVDPRKRPSVRDLLEHPWISQKVNIHPALEFSATTDVLNSNEPVSNNSIHHQRKSSTANTSSVSHHGTPKPQRKAFSSAESMNGNSFGDSPVRTYANCQCGPSCRHLSHTPVAKTPPITVDRGILC